jgi:Sigma 54 modulation/S30EA ribosomal protein C terminus
MRRACDRRKTRNSAHGVPTEALAAQPAELFATQPATTPAAADGESAAGHPDHAPATEPEWLDTQLELEAIVPIPMEGNGPLVVREKFHAATPMTIDRALLEMELVGHDFFLFRDEDCHLPSVVYRRRGYDYGVIRLIEQTARMADGIPAQSALGHLHHQVGPNRFTG